MKETNESLITDSLIKEEPCESNENVNAEPNIPYASIKIKEEDIKLEPDFDSYCDEQDSNIEQSASRMVEFVEMQIVKTEKVDEYDEEEDPIKINKGSFICDYCKRAFTTAGYCQKHIRRCKDRVYNQPSTSATTIPDKKPRLTNDGEQLYQCDKCDNKYRSYMGLSQHLRRHSGIGLHTCSDCNKQFTKPSHLATHMLTHTGEKPHKCTWCESAFITASNLKTHMLTHTGARPHVCTECGQSFTSSSNLTTHMRNHTGEKPYQCTRCNRAFTQSSHLTEHMRIHNGEKPYKCTVCSQAYTHSGGLKKHMKIHSNENKQ